MIEAIGKLLEDKFLSDVHIKSGSEVWKRASGDMTRLEELQANDENILDLLTAINAKFKGVDLHAHLKSIATAEKEGDDFSGELSGQRLRGNLSLTDNEKLMVVLRKLSTDIPSLDDLGLPDNYKILIGRANGLCLVTGATGSGKSTTLASTLQYKADTEPGHILTIEDPVEYVLKTKMSLVNQKQVGRDTITFGAGMRSSLRQDPDVVMFGEIRDYETMKTAMDMAETGHLVFGTLHTNGAVSTIERCMSFFPPEEKELARNALANTLVFVISQVLVRKMQEGGGRVMAYEMLINTMSTRQNIAEGKLNQIISTMETGSTEGQVLLHKMLAKYVKEGVVSREDALRAANNPERLKKELKL